MGPTWHPPGAGKWLVLDWMPLGLPRHWSTLEIAWPHQLMSNPLSPSKGNMSLVYLCSIQNLIAHPRTEGLQERVVIFHSQMA